jgi:NAD(P)-dependent dehydrogenase (short-subunit alcohol dehydrogenase family)
MNAVITGASRGIGLELVRESLNRGDQVLAVARQPQDSAALMALAKKFSGTLSLCQADLNFNQQRGNFSQRRNPRGFRSEFSRQYVYALRDHQSLAAQVAPKLLASRGAGHQFNGFDRRQQFGRKLRLSRLESRIEHAQQMPGG